MRSPFPMPVASEPNPTSCTASAVASSSWGSVTPQGDSINSCSQPAVDINRPSYSLARWGVPYFNGGWPRMDSPGTQPVIREGCSSPSRDYIAERISTVDEARAEPPRGSMISVCEPPRSEPSLTFSRECSRDSPWPAYHSRVLSAPYYCPKPMSSDLSLRPMDCNSRSQRSRKS